MGALEVPATDPGHQAAEAGTGFLDGVLLALLEQLVIALHAGAALLDPFAGKLPVADLLEDGLHGLFRPTIDHTGTAGDVAVLGGFGNGEAHTGDAGFVDQIHDQFQFVQDLEIGDFRLVAGFHQNFKARLNQGGGSTAEHGLFAEEIGFRLLLEGRLEQPGAGGANSAGPGHGDRPGLSGGVLLNGKQGGNAPAFLILAANDMTGAFGGHQDHVDVFGRTNGFVMDGEAVAEKQALTFAQVGSDVLFIDRGNF